MTEEKITLTYPQHKVEYESISEMLDYEISELFEDHIEPEEMTEREKEKARKVLKHYKDKLDG